MATGNVTFFSRSSQPSQPVLEEFLTSRIEDVCLGWKDPFVALFRHCVLIPFSSHTTGLSDLSPYSFFQHIFFLSLSLPPPPPPSPWDFVLNKLMCKDSTLLALLLRGVYAQEVENELISDYN